MMNMQINCCKGCFYVGTANGFKPECNCHKVAEAETRANDMVDFWDQYFEDDTVSDFTDTKDRSKAVRRRINKAKANKKAVEILPIVQVQQGTLQTFCRNYRKYCKKEMCFCKKKR